MRLVYINLDREAERRAFMERQASLLNLSFERFAAVEPKNFAAGEYEHYTATWQRPMAPNEVAVFLSHRALWKMAAQEPEGMIIMEDDAVLSPRLPAAIRQLPPGFDLINLEDFERRKFMARAEPVPAPGGEVTQVVRDMAGAAGYFISPTGAAKLVQVSENRAAPVDAFLFAVAHSSAKMRLGQFEPALVIQEQFLTARNIDVGIRTTSHLRPRKRLALVPANAVYFARRIAAQVGLFGLQLQRLIGLSYRRPKFDEQEFRDNLPIR